MTGSTTIDENKSGASELSASEQQQNLIVERLASLFGDATQLDNVGNEMRLRCKVETCSMCSKPFVTIPCSSSGN